MSLAQALAALGRRRDERVITRRLCDFGDIIDNQLLLSENASITAGIQGVNKSVVDTILEKLNTEFKDMVSCEYVESTTEGGVSQHTVKFNKILN